MDAFVPLIIVGSLIAFFTIVLIVFLWLLDRTDRWPVKVETKQWNKDMKQRKIEEKLAKKNEKLQKKAEKMKV